jgi:hypothetical protein
MISLFDQPEGHERRCCDACGQRIRKINPHHMDLAKVNVLAEIGRRNRGGHLWVKLQRDGKLIHADDAAHTIQTDDVHGLRLKWFGLVDSGGFRSGKYRINASGVEFLAGRLQVPRTIWCKDGEVVSRDDETVGVDEVRGLILNKDYWDNYWTEQEAPR